MHRKKGKANKMKKRFSAMVAAVLAASMMFSACGSKVNEDEVVDTSINVITNAEQATDPAISGGNNNVNTGEGDVTGTVSDPGEEYQFTGSETIPSEFLESEYTAVSVTENQQIQDMIQNGGDTSKVTHAPILKEYNVDYTTRYAYNQLNAAEKKLYGQILEAANGLKAKITVDENVTDEMWIKVYGCMYMQEPQLFWLASKKVKKGRLYYWENDPDAISKMQKSIDTTVSKILGEAEGKNTFDKLKVFHDYIGLNNDFVKEEGFNQTIYGGFSKGQIQCEGYAKCMQYLCDLAGIESVVIVGTNESGDTHAWNCVKVDGDWYNIDATWDDPILTNVDKTNIRYRYFLVPDSWIHNKSHFNINKKITGTAVTYFTPPSCSSDKMNYFNVTKQLYSDVSSADAAIKAAMKSAADSKLRVAEIRVSGKSVYDSITANLKDYATWIKNEKPAVKSVSSNCDPNTLVIELDLAY